MLRIRLRRVGKKKQPMYRIVVAESRSPRDGAFVESLGYYHPLDNPSTIVLDSERTRLWLNRGAQPSDRVAKLLAVQGIAELSPRLAARIELGQRRAKEAAAAEKAKPQAEAAAAPAAMATEAPAAEAPEEEAAKAAEEGPAEAEAPEEPPSEEVQPEEPEAAAEEEQAKA